MVGDSCVKTDADMRTLLEITYNALSTVQMTFTRLTMIASKSHNSIDNVKAAKGKWSIAKHQSDSGTWEYHRNHMAWRYLVQDNHLSPKWTSKALALLETKGV